MKRILVSIAALLFSLSLTACGGSYFRSSDARRSRSPGEEKNRSQNRPAPGQLTSGEWSDIKNYKFYLDLFNIINDPDIEESQRRNSFLEFIDYFGFETRYMITVNVVHGGLPAGDVSVELYDSNQNILFSAKTNVLGNAYLFPSYDISGNNITVKVKSGSYEFTRQFNNAQSNLQITLENSAAALSVLDLMFVIDTTGSMGDELRYLKEEILDVIGKISDNNQNYTINLALLFYRDINDEYVTRYFDFTTDIAQQQRNLSRQSANGGGDYPEAVDRALWEALGKNWSGGYATRLIFHVCDAPPHDKQENATLYFNSVKEAARKGIRIIPVASSGINLAAEYLLRQEALMTGGTYIFLTDDSSIGYSHLPPTVGEYTVEYLNACMVRIVNEYLSGVETAPVPYN
jgi:predicted small lipoprotein YifL